MITEEMLEFIRAGRATGMTDDELTQLLVTEGGWERADVEEAYRALERVIAPAIPPPEVVPPAVAKTIERTTESVIAPEPSAPTPPPVFSPSALTPPPAPPPTITASTSLPVPPRSITEAQPLTPSEKTYQAESGIRPILSGPSGDQPLVQTKIPHDQFLNLFSDKASFASKSAAGTGTDEIKPITDAPRRDDSLAIVPPDIVATVPQQPAIKNPQWSLNGLLAEKEKAPATPLNNLASKVDKSLPPTGTTPPPAVSPAIKFDLYSALRATPPVPATSPSLSTIPGAEKLSAESASAGFVTPERGVRTEAIHPASETHPTPPSGVLGGAEKEAVKKTPFTGKRTMMSDLERKSDIAPASPPSLTPPSPLQVREEIDREKKKEKPESPPLPATPALFPDDVTRREKLKRMLIIAVGALLFLAILGGGIFAFMKFRSPDPSALLGTAFAQFFESSSFAYQGTVNIDLALAGIPPRGKEGGRIKFVANYRGSLANSRDGYGDGTHKLVWNGGWQFGTSTFGTTIESDVLVIGNESFFNILAIPDESDLDPALLRANWVKVNFFDIAREFQLSSVMQGEEEYGSFGGTTGETSFSALLQKMLPFASAADPRTEDLAGVAAFRIHVLPDPDRLLELLRTIYRRYWNRDLTFSEEELLRFKGALQKLGGDVWIDAQSGTLIKIAVTGNFDDDIGAVHVKGPLALEFTFADFNKPALFGTPSPVLSLQELKVKLEESKKIREARAKDEIRLSHMALLVEALRTYRNEKGRYPKELTELLAAKKITESSIPLATLKDYAYRSYLKSGNFTKGGACLTTGKVCAYYHLGTNLLDPKNAALESDADQTTAILGADSAGCAGEKNNSCYDVVSPPTSPATPTPSAAKSSSPASSAVSASPAPPASGAAPASSAVPPPAPAAATPTSSSASPAPAPAAGTVPPPPPPAP